MLAACARLTGDALFYQQLAHSAGQFTRWDELAVAAEKHGLGPLVYTHLKAAGVHPPRRAQQLLQGLYLRHRRAGQIRANVLPEILLAFRRANINVLLLKGVALAHAVYPQPGLRPMRDVDLLVKKEDMWQAQHVLTELGFDAPAKFPVNKTSHHHLASATKQVDGLSISVEIHHDVFQEEDAPDLSLDTLSSPPLAFNLPNGQPAPMLGGADMLWHLCHHISDLYLEFRLIWLVDIVGFAEKFADDIDWAVIKQNHGRVLDILALFHFVTPLSENLQRRADLKFGRRPAGIGQEFCGWPRYALSRQRDKGTAAILRDTFHPPEWWLRLYYGVGPGRSLVWHRWLKHPLFIARLALQTISHQSR